jgi:hypothetical protein
MSDKLPPIKEQPERLGAGALRLSAVDLRGLSDEEHTELRQAAIRLGISLPELLGKIVTVAVRRRLNPEHLGDGA